MATQGAATCIATMDYAAHSLWEIPHSCLNTNPQEKFFTTKNET